MITALDRHTAPVIALDWDGTVVDSVPYKLAQNLALAAEFGNHLTIDEVRREWNATSGFPDLMHRLTGSDDIDRVMEVVKRDYNNPAYAKREFDFAKATLAALRAEGYKLAIITNATREILQVDARDLGFSLEHDFDYTQTADESEFKKPHPRTFERLCQHFSITAAQLLYVGDELKDYEATVNGGNQFVGVATVMTAAEEFAARNIPCIQTIAELPNYLKGGVTHGTV